MPVHSIKVDRRNRRSHLVEPAGHAGRSVLNKADQVVDPAIPPDKRSFPKRALIVIGATFAGFFFGVFFALMQAGLGRMKDDPEASEKFVLLKRALAVGKLRAS